ncbi:MAG: VOC family protein [Oligoflexia bacterium]|nr:VOC family protein [Oligoflexia bacterium]
MRTEIPFGNIDHVAIVVKNLKKTISFYENYLGFKIEREFGNKELGVRAVVLKRKSSRIELFEYKNSKPTYAKNICQVHGAKVPKSYFEPGIKHIAFRTSKFDSAVEKMKKAGIKPWIKPKKGYSGDSITFFQDPNGILLEVVSPINKR